MLFRKKIKRSCVYCAHGTQIGDEYITHAGSSSMTRASAFPSRQKLWIFENMTRRTTPYN